MGNKHNSFHFSLTFKHLCKMGNRDLILLSIPKVKCLPQVAQLGKDRDSTPLHHASFQWTGWTKISDPTLTSMGFHSFALRGQCWLINTSPAPIKRFQK